MGLSRDTFYRYQSAVETGGVEALVEKSRRRPNQKNRTDEATEAAVVAFALENPAFGPLRASNELRKRGVFISASGVRCVWLRHELASFKRRLIALERQMAERGGLVLTEAQVVALERKRDDDLASGEIETAHPGYLGSQDTFYVGTLKGVGRIYQQTFVDTYAKVAFAKVYDRKTPLEAADLLNDRVVPFFDEHGVRLQRMLTDRGTEFCGNPERHEYELYLGLEDIEHTKTRVKRPQTNGICERLNKTLLDEFYRVAFRRKIYGSLAELQADLDAFLAYYNTERPHQGRWCYGKTPMQTFLDSVPLAQEKVLAA